jgi:exopolysaccharide biosynthesis protein
LLTYPAAIIEKTETRILRDKVQTIVTLSNPTRIVAAQNKLDVNISLAAARRPEVAPVQAVRDYLVQRTALSSGNWRASFSLRTNYMAPVQWFTTGSPARVVIEVQRLFEEAQTNSLGGGIAFTKIRKGTNHGPVQMFLARVDPQDGWRVRVAPAGYSVLQRARPSVLASRHRALLAVNGGFFAYDGAAVGAMLVNGEWIRLPWGGRTAIGFKPDGSAHIGNLHAMAEVRFGGENGHSLPVRELNGWPDGNRITALTTRFGPSYKLKSGEMALVVKGGKVIARPGGGYVAIHGDGFTLVGGGAARPYLEKIQRGEKAQLKVSAPGWEGVTTALGGGPRLVENGQVRVTGENFRADVRVGRGPRTAMGIDKNGGYIILVVDGRQGYYSTGMTLTELAYTMLKLGAVDAINFDGGGSTAMVVRNRIINRPSDGRERSVSNALVVMR